MVREVVLEVKGQVVTAVLTLVVFARRRPALCAPHETVHARLCFCQNYGEETCVLGKKRDLNAESVRSSSCQVPLPRAHSPLDLRGL